MSSRLNGRSPAISPVLFLNVRGEPMRFYLRPGPTKVELLPMINAGGGILCRAQEPNAILLADPKDITPAMASTAHFYISTLYVRDCVERNEQLDVEEYRFTEHVQTRSSRQKREGSGGLGRMSYTQQEDAAILNFMAKHKGETRGNLVWQEMEKKGLISRSWQSMKDRYRKHLCSIAAEEKVERQATPLKKNCLRSSRHKQATSPGALPDLDESTSKVGLDPKSGSEAVSEAVPEAVPEAVSEAVSEPDPVSEAVSEAVSEPDPESEAVSEAVSKPDPVSEAVSEPVFAPVSEADPVSELELHLESEAVKAELDQSSELDVLEPELGQSFKEEVLEPETGHAPEPEVLEPDLGQPSEEEVLEPELGQPSEEEVLEPELGQPSEEEVLELGQFLESEVPEPKTAPEPKVRKPASDTPKTSNEDDLLSTASDTTNLLQTPPQPQASPTTPEALPSFQSQGAPERRDSSHEGQQRASKQRRRSGMTSSTPASKRARAASPAGENTELEDAGPSGENAVPFNHKQTEPQKKKSKRRCLGILEKASREFEVGSSGESCDESLDMEVGIAASPPEPGNTVAPAPAPACLTQTHTSDTEAAVVPQPHPQPQPQPKLKAKKTEAQVPCEADLPEVPVPEPEQREPVPSTSTAHMFLFDNDSQELESSQPIRDEVAFTQVQVEEAKRSIKRLMEETNQDLVAVTKALIKFSGDLSAVLIYLNNGTGAGPIWERCDDKLLKSADLSKLRLKYGDETVAKRLAFLDME